MAADRITVIAIALLVLILPPQMVVLAKPAGNTMSPRPKQQQLGNFFKKHGSDMAGLIPRQRNGRSGSYNGRSVPADGGSTGGGGGQSQDPATNAGMYVSSFNVGTPPQLVSGVLDITSDFVWMQCSTPTSSCATCAAQPTATAPTPPFYTFLSSTIREVRCANRGCQQLIPQTCNADDSLCGYSYTYGGGRANTTAGFFAVDALAFATVRADDVVFGCAVATEGDIGAVIGLGRGELSLVSQLNIGRFSYYLAPDDDDSVNDNIQSFILFLDDATPRTSRAVSTPLLASRAFPSLYFVELASIRVDGEDLAIPSGTFDLQADGSGRVVLSITVPVTFLDAGAYEILRQAMASAIGLSTVDGSALGLDLCYTSESLATAKVPAMALVFSGGTVMELEMGNYFYMDSTTGLVCLTILPSPAGDGSLLGSLIQIGTHMIYDIKGSRLVFESLKQAPPPPPSQQASWPSKSYKQGVGRRSSSPPRPLISPAMVVIHFMLVVVYIFF